MKSIRLCLLALSTATILATGTLTGCTFKYDEFNRRVMEEGETYSISYARIISVMPVTIKEQRYNSGAAATVGAIGGAAVGGIVGYNVGHRDGWDHYYGRGSSTGMFVGGLLGAGVGLLAGVAAESANNVKGLRLNLKDVNGDNYAIDVPADDALVPGSYVQVNTTQSGYSQVIPLTEEAYNLAISN